MFLSKKVLLDVRESTEYLVNNILFTWLIENNDELNVLYNLIYETLIKEQKAKILATKELDILNCSVEDIWYCLSANISEEKTVSNSEDFKEETLPSFESSVEKVCIHENDMLHFSQVTPHTLKQNSSLYRIHLLDSKIKVPSLLVMLFLCTSMWSFCKNHIHFEFRFLHDPGG